MKWQYEISSYGRCRNLHWRWWVRILKNILWNTGYHYITLRIAGRIHRKSIHRLVATEFLSKACWLNVVNHINAIKIDNRKENLEWCTQKHNVNEALRMWIDIWKWNKWKYWWLHHNSKKVLCLFNDGSFHKSYDSIADASRDTNIDACSIIKACKWFRKTAGSFIWNYIIYEK